MGHHEDRIAHGGRPFQPLVRSNRRRPIDRLVTGPFDYARADIDERPRLQTTDLAEAVIDGTAAFELAADERGVRLQVTAHARPSVLIDRDGSNAHSPTSSTMRCVTRRAEAQLTSPAAKMPIMPSSASSMTVPASRPTSFPTCSS